MHHKKPKVPVDSEKSPEEKELEDRIDALLDPSRADPAAPAVQKSAETAPPLDIFAGQKTAPELTDAAPEHKADNNAADNGQAEKEDSVAKETEKQDEAEPITKPEAEPKIPPESAQDDTNDPLPDDAETSKAVDEITRSESDALLKAEDEKAMLAAAPKPKKSGRKFGIFAHAWVRRVIVLVLLLVLAGAAAWPTSRYFVLNTAGVRSSASLKVVDLSTGLPLRDAAVRLGELSAKSDQEGMVKFPEVRLGEQVLSLVILSWI